MRFRRLTIERLSILAGSLLEHLKICGVRRTQELVAEKMVGTEPHDLLQLGNCTRARSELVTDGRQPAVPLGIVRLLVDDDLKRLCGFNQLPRLQQRPAGQQMERYTEIAVIANELKLPQGSPGITTAKQETALEKALRGAPLRPPDKPPNRIPDNIEGAVVMKGGDGQIDA